MPVEPEVFKKLKELGETTVQQVESRLLSGEGTTSVARHLKHELGAFPDLKEDSVKKNLDRYNAKVLKPRVLKEISDRAKGKSASGLQAQLNAMDEMTDLVDIQRGRLDKVLVVESKMTGMVAKHVTNEVRLLKELLVELGKLQLDTGVMRRAPKTVTGHMHNPASGEISEFTWTEEQEDLYKQLETVPQLEGEILDDVVKVEGAGIDENTRTR